MKQTIKKRLRWNFDNPEKLLAWKKVSTVCEESRCPNRHECSQEGLATFMIGGATCTRSCRFCHIATGKPPALTKELISSEKNQLLSAVSNLELSYIVITSVARDDSEKELAREFAEITDELRKQGKKVELLIPDFHLNSRYLEIIGRAAPTVIAHNIETVERLSREIRPQAGYRRSLDVFRYFRNHHPVTIRKSGFMVGLGESTHEIAQLLEDMKDAGVEIVTVGQYLQPSSDQASVTKYYNEEEFAELEKMIEKANFAGWEVGYYVRSSYMASRTLRNVQDFRIIVDNLM